MKDKAIIFDIDGTAIDSPKQKTASKKLIDAIEELKNSYYRYHLWGGAEQYNSLNIIST